jgi:2-isopropylmalate synthase
MDRQPGTGWVRDTFQVYDTTLRDGSQGEGMAFSVADKLAIARLLDELGVGFIEAGWPGASPKDTEVFRRAGTELDLQTSRLVAFGATRRAGSTAEHDPQVLALLESQAPAVTVVAKGSLRHVNEALRTTAGENLAMVADTVRLLVAEGRQVFVDVEHCFDGYALDAAYTTEVVRAAHESGVDAVVLCDTNGGQLPWQVGDAVQALLEATDARLGIHVHDDTGCGPANTLAAVRAGATHVQGAFNGYGERAGNADLVTVIANLSLKMGVQALPPGRLAELTRVSHAVAALSNRPPRRQAPYVGASAFAHKAGLHASALKVHADLYQHTDPALVGNDMRLLVSELAGRATIELKGRELGLDLSTRPEVVAAVTAAVKDRESHGYSYEAAEASFELLLREHLAGEPLSAWDTESWRVIVEAPGAEATVKVLVKGERVCTVGEGNGPVDALDHALRKALEATYPALARLELTDYAVRILEDAHGTGAITRVLLTMSDGTDSWVTVGVDPNIVQASWQALTDAYTYGLLCR